MEDVTLKRLQEVWSKILKDKDARRALKRLEKDGLGISHLTPRDATFKHPTWADYIAAIPLLPNRPSRRRIHSKTALRKHWPLVRALRRFAQKVNDPFCEKRIVSNKDISFNENASLGRRLSETADFVEKFLSWDWYTRDRNRRNALIAELRCTIRERTGRPHDVELGVLIDAAFQAAGATKHSYIEPSTLDRIEKREKEGRVRAAHRLRSRAGLIPLA